MKKKVLTGILSALLASTSFGAAGFGAHWSGLDFSVTMDDAVNQAVTFEGLTLDRSFGFSGAFAGSLPTTFDANEIPIYVDRSGFEHHPASFGAKFFIDVVPLIDAIELTANFGVWQYDGMVRYPSSIATNANPGTVTSLIELEQQNLVTVQYDTLDLTLEGNGQSFMGLTGTPYAKLQFDLGFRKFIKLPVIHKVLKTYAGGGFSLIFATPGASAGLISDAIGDAMSAQTAQSILDLTTNLGPNSTAGRDIIDEILARLFTPHFGLNIQAGVMLKPPVIPFGLYVDGKFNIPFGELDEDAGVKGLGFLLNMGVALAF